MSAYCCLLLVVYSLVHFNCCALPTDLTVLCSFPVCFTDVDLPRTPCTRCRYDAQCQVRPHVVGCSTVPKKLCA